MVRPRYWLALAAAALAAAQGPLKREGAGWAQDSGGSVATTAVKLKVVSPGPITVRGGGESIRYSIKRRARAGSEAEARQVLDAFQVKTRTSGDWLVLWVEAPARGAGTPELALSVPRGLKECVIEARGGRIEAFDLDGGVEAHTTAGGITIDRVAGPVKAHTGGGEVRLGWIGGAVRCISGGGSVHLERAGGEALIETAGGEIVVGEAGGQVRASTAGNIHVRRAAGSVTAHAAGGLIEVQHSGGAVIAETSGGSIQVGGARGARLESAAGAIRLRGVTGALRASTALGNILADLQAGVAGDSFLGTVRGDITVYIPSNLAVTVRARSEAGSRGRIVSEFPEIRLQPDPGDMLRPVAAEGALNGGGPLLTVAAGQGSVFLRRQK